MEIIKDLALTQCRYSQLRNILKNTFQILLKIIKKLHRKHTNLYIGDSNTLLCVYRCEHTENITVHIVLKKPFLNTFYYSEANASEYIEERN